MKVWEDPKEGADESSDSMATAVQMGWHPCCIPRGRRVSWEAQVLGNMGLQENFWEEEIFLQNLGWEEKQAVQESARSRQALML